MMIIERLYLVKLYFINFLRYLDGVKNYQLESL